MPPETSGEVPDVGAERQPWWRRRPLLLAGGVVAALILVTVGVLALSGPGSKDLRVTFSLYDFTGTSSCDGGTGGYNDIGPGTDVVIKNNGGKVVGTAQLGDGPSSKLPPATGEDFTPGGCIWSTTVKGVPAGDDFYTVTVGSRGTQTYSRSDLDKDKWSLDLTLGGS